MTNEFKENDQEGQSEIEGQEIDPEEDIHVEIDFKDPSELFARKIQMALMTAIYTQLTANPGKVPASTMAVAERLIARLNMGLIELPDEEDLSEEEKEILKNFEEMTVASDMSNDQILQ
jgi:hypothetical protein